MTEQPGELAHLLGAHVDAGALAERLRTVVDPELGVNIVDLGRSQGSRDAARNDPNRLIG